MKRTSILLSALFVSSIAASAASAEDEPGRAPSEVRENARQDDARRPTTAPVREELEIIEDDRRAPEAVEQIETMPIARLCAAYDEGGTAHEECWDVFNRMDNNSDGVITHTEATAKYGDILIDGVPLEFD